MKKLTFFVALLVLGTGAASAQTVQKDQGRGKSPSAQQHKGQHKSAATPQEPVGQIVAQMTEKYGLTAAQSAKIQDIGLAFYTEMQAMRQNRTEAGAKELSRAQMQALKEKYTAQVKAVLSPTQYAQFEADLAKHTEQYGQGKGQYNKQKQS
jgi:hypothetical protein